MSENYKITKKIALRIIELRNDGNSFQTISNQINSEYEIKLGKSSVSRFFNSFLKGKSRILPKNEIGIELKTKPISERSRNIHYAENSKSPTNDNNLVIDKDLKDSAIYQGLSNSSLNKAKPPSDDLLGLFVKKPIVK